MKKIITLLLLATMSLGTVAPTYATPPQQHLKKDGTPDKRFKENKTSKSPLTKSGKPDARYKVNKPVTNKKKHK